MRSGLVPVLLALLVGTGRAAELPPLPDPELRAVIVEEDGDTVEVWIALPAGVDAGSVEVQLAGRVVAVRARDDEGRMLRSAPLQSRDAVVEDGAEARWEGAWLVVELHKDTGPLAF